MSRRWCGKAFSASSTSLSSRSQAITADGELIPSSSVGNNKTWIDLADRVILEVNSWQPIELEGMHDIYYGTALPAEPPADPDPARPSDRIGVPYLRCPPEKIVAVVPTHVPDRNTPFKPTDADVRLIAGHVVDFLRHEVKQGRLPGRCCRCSPVSATSPTP